MDSESVGGRIEAAIERLPPGGVTLAQLQELIGKEGLMILAAFLTLVFLIPVSIPGVSTVFGAGILLIGISRLFGRDLWLPETIAKRAISTEKLRGAMTRGMIWFRKLEKVSRPNRMPWLTGAGLTGLMNNLALILGAVLLMMPFGPIPFSNTFPAVALLFLAIGLLQHDGVCILLGHLGNLASIAYFTVLIAGGGVAIQKVWQQLVGAMML